MKSNNIKFSKWFCIFIIIMCMISGVIAQVPGTLEKNVRVGTLQSHFTAYGFERAFNGSVYLGVKWPADYLFQDNAVIERAWVAASGFTDEKGKNWENYGVYFDASTVGSSVFPMKHEQIGRFKSPIVYVDGVDITAPYAGEVDRYDSNIKADRIIHNVVNTNLGLTMRKKIYAFSQQYHDDYFIKEYTFINTGNTDYDDDIELTADLSAVRIGWANRYNTCRDGADKYDREQLWGKYSWVSKRGEDYAAHAGESITEANPIVDWLRVAFTWAGQSENRPDWDNIGAPDINGTGRLSSPQILGNGVIHVDKAYNDPSDDPGQPFLMGWHAGDILLQIADQLNINDPEGMNKVYRFLSGTPMGGQNMGGTDRYYESHTTSITDRFSPVSVHNDVGGTGIWITYGPFDIPHGDSIRIVEVEAVAGLSRPVCEEIGAKWLDAYNTDNFSGSLSLPDGSTTSDYDYYKNAWVYTGWDSLFETVGRAKRNFDMDFNIPQPPLPPAIVEVNSGGDRITLSWTASESESESDFGGYKIFRSVGKTDTVFEHIFSCGLDTDHPDIVHEYEDLSPVRGFAYYYYIQAFNDGSNNISGEANPQGKLYSNRFYTRTTEPAFLRRQAGKNLDDIRIVPNPFNIKARSMNYPNEPDKLGFLDIPAFCKIRIYTERGDLIYEIDHNDGSGDEFWNSITSSRQVVVSGLYIAYFEVTQDYDDPETGERLYNKGDSTFRKFVIIR